MVIKPFGKVVIHCPAAVGYHIGEASLTFHVALCDDVLTHIPPAFALAGQKSHPIERPVFIAVVALVFYVIPHAEGNF